jgi:hypothetical protein
MINRTIQLEEITIIYLLNTGGPNYIRQKLLDLKGETNSSTIIGRDFNTPLSFMNRLSIQNRNIRVKNNTLYYRPN